MGNKIRIISALVVLAWVGFVGIGHSQVQRMDSARLETLLAKAWGKSLNELREAVDKAEIGPLDVGTNHNWPLLALAYNNDAEYVGKLLAAGVDINATNQNGCTALHYCAEYGCLKAAASLIEHGAKLNLQTKWGETPLVLACNGYQREMASLLLAAKTDLEIPAQFGPAIFYAVRDEGTLKQFLDFGVDANSREIITGNTVLIGAVGNLQSVRLLLNAGAEINATNKAGRTALLEALKNGHVATAEALLDAGADWQLKDLEGNSAILYAANAPSSVMIDRLTKLGANTNEIHLCDLHLSAVTNTSRLWPYALTAFQVMDECLRYNKLEENQNSYVRGMELQPKLTGYWGVKYKANMMEAVKQFESSSAGAEFAEIAKAVGKLTDQQFELEQADLLVSDPHQRQQRQIVRKYLAQGGKGDLAGWEASCYIHLLQLGRARGFLNEKDCWDRITSRLKPLQDRFSSWEEFAHNVRVGYEFKGAAGFAKYDLIERLLLNKADSNSPWNQVSWPQSRKPVVFFWGYVTIPVFLGVLLIFLVVYLRRRKAKDTKQ